LWKLLLPNSGKCPTSKVESIVLVFVLTHVFVFQVPCSAALYPGSACTSTINTDGMVMVHGSCTSTAISVAVLWITWLIIAGVINRAVGVHYVRNGRSWCLNCTL
jgi:hypothetical protein